MARLLPTARQSGLASEKLEDELLVYDLERDKAYCLNHTAALVWKHCDGRTSPAEIAKLLKKKIGAPMDEKVVWYALDQLGRDRLLEERLPLPGSLAGMTRRQHLRALGKVAAIAVPIVTALIAPTPAMAASCGGHQCPQGGTKCANVLCQNNGECCSNLCKDQGSGSKTCVGN